MRGDEARLPVLVDKPDGSHFRVASVRGLDDAVHTVPRTIIRRRDGGDFFRSTSPPSRCRPAGRRGTPSPGRRRSPTAGSCAGAGDVEQMPLGSCSALISRCLAPSFPPTGAAIAASSPPLVKGTTCSTSACRTLGMSAAELARRLGERENGAATSRLAHPGHRPGTRRADQRPSDRPRAPTPSRRSCDVGSRSRSTSFGTSSRLK